ncbi:MAG: hypothetical protein ACE5NP_09915 [Anaerolineae bacterium]
MPTRFDRNLILVILLSVFAFAPLTYPGFFQSHSGFLSIFNLLDLDANLAHNWSWVPTVGRDLHLFIGEGPVPYALAQFFHLLGLGPADAVKAVYALAFILSGLGLYAFARTWLGASAALVASVVYIYLPYHLATTYVRGSLGESLALALFPTILWAMTAENSRTSPSRLILAGLLVAMLILTQAGLATLFVLVVLAYVTLALPSRQGMARRLVASGAGFVLGWLLFLPAIIRQGFRLTSAGDFYQHFVYPFQLLAADWEYGASQPGWRDTLPLQIGVIPVGLGLLSLFLLASRKERNRGLRRTIIFFATTATLLVVLTLPFSSPLWRVTLLSYLVQYPWQLLALVGLAVSFLAGSVAALDERLASFPIQAALITMAILASYTYLMPQFIDHVPSEPPVAVLGENQIVLIDYELKGPLRHGATIRLRPRWQALKPLEKDYTIFVQVVDEQGTIWGQQDREPRDGDRPTTTWQPGEILEDEYEVTIDVEGPRQGYHIELGMYDVETGERMKAGPDRTSVTIQGREQ